ncbi:PREDICTED: golgin subfamily A member 2 [Nanorana parkeri]|uniref:golgin subfamily A member 2 n=1 Tax=Nanorana parkeri TaxID=125878 RepID=UPI00085419F0|nr:PREDICTED: golgin subfamily A member 2 [Nanorana parkeri]
MADDRQHKLAAARRKLKEYQQKTTPPTAAGGKKKKKGKESNSHPDTPNRLSPDPIEAILKGLVSDLHRTNGVSIPTLDDRKVILEQDVAHDVEILSEDVYDNTKTPTETDFDNPLAENDLDGKKVTSDGNRFVSSTDSLRQLSEQLNGLVSQNNSYMNGENVSSSPELESRFQDLSAALDSSNLTNKQLSAKIEELKLQNQDVMEKLDKERKVFDQRFSKEQSALREQLQVHIQTIGILVSEKSELQTALSFTQQAARQKGAEVEDLVMRLQSTRQRVTELERTLSSLSAQQKQLEKLNKELEKDRDNLRLESLKNSKCSEELKQQNSELSEKLNALLSENAAMKLELGDLRKKLEMAELMIQQFSNQTGTPDANQQLLMVLEERDQLGTQLAQMSNSLQQLTAERDQYVGKLKEEGAIWQERVRQLSDQIQTLSQEKDSARVQVEQLETRVTELLLASAAESADTEPPAQQGPSEEEQALQREVEKLQQEFQELQSRYRALVQDNSQLSRLNQEQEERLLELEKSVQRQSEDNVDKQQILENMQSDKATISRALTQNRQLKEQLAEFQNGFVKLTNENLELTNGLQSEQHVKKELAKRLGQLQESLGDFKEQLAIKDQEVQLLTAQRDEISAHLQQYVAAYQQVSIEREEIQRQYLLQAQLMDRLQHDEVQGKVSVEMHLKELQQSRESLELLTKENQELRAQVLQIRSDPDSRVLSRMEGDGVESIVYEDEIPKTSLAVPEDFETREEMMTFLSSAISKLHGERDEVERQLMEQKRTCKQLLQEISELRQQQQLSPPLHHSAELGVETVPREVYDALQSAMEKLQFRFTSLMQERVELKERVEELEHRCIQLSGETDTIGEYIALYQSQRAILKQRHTEKEDYISRLAQDKEEMKAKLLELQVLVMRLVGERNDWYKKYAEAAKGFKDTGDTALISDKPMELGAADGEVLEEVSLMEDSEQEKAQISSRLSATQEGSSTTPSSTDPTAKQIMQLLREIQNPQERSNSLLRNPCIPFFYRVDENDEVRIMVV